MDFIAAKASAAREIALAFDVPPMLLGLPGDDTFANDAEANRSFWRQTVLPLVGRTAQALARWLAPDEPGLRLVPDLDRIDVLSDEREALWWRADHLIRSTTMPTRPGEERASAHAFEEASMTEFGAGASTLSSILEAFLTRGDLADLALFLWACAASLAAGLLLRELGAANRRFDVFVRELHRFNSRFDGRD